MAKSCGGLATKADDLDGEAYYPASRSLGNDLHEIPIGIAQQGVAVVVAGVVRWLEHRYLRSREFSACQDALSA